MRGQSSSQPSDQIARRNYLGNGTGTRHAFRHAQRDGFSNRRSWYPRALQAVSGRDVEFTSETRKYFYDASSS